jgi:hypothetical protein
MKRRAGGQPVKSRRRKAVTLKHRTAPKAVRRHGRSAGNLQEQLDLRTRELNEALSKLSGGHSLSSVRTMQLRLIAFGRSRSMLTSSK